MTRMAVLRRLTVVDLSNDQLTAVHLRVSRQQVIVAQQVCIDVPADIDQADDDWMGKWIGRTLKDHHFGRDPVVFVTPRQSVGLKRLVLPTLNEAELPSMVQLKLAGQLPFPIEGSVVDYVIIERRDAAQQTEIVAAAVRSELLERYRKLADAGGFKLVRVALRPLATAALLADLSNEHEGSLLGIDLRGYGEVELVVCSNGQAVFARGAEVIAPSEQVDRHEEARRLATEAKRSWMSFRATEEAPDVKHVVIVGTDGLAGSIAEEVHTALGRSAEVFLSHPKVTGRTEELGPAWPLVGIGIEYQAQRDRIDFFNPKKAPDLAAQRRIRYMVASAAAVIVLLVLWTVGNTRLNRLRQQLATIEDNAAGLSQTHQNFIRHFLQLQHYQMWSDARFNWLDHFRYISDHLPDPTEAILGPLTMSMPTNADATFDSRKKQMVPPRVYASIQLVGAAINRTIADNIRGTFVDDPHYRTESIGADTKSNDKTYIAAVKLQLTSVDADPYTKQNNNESASSAAAGAEPQTGTSRREGNH